MRLTRLSLALFLVVAGACSSATEPRPRELLGRWTRSEPSSPMGTVRTALTFAASGRFEFDVRLYGIYAAQPAGELSAFGRYVGRYSITGDSIDLRPDTLVSWDRFSGAGSPTTVRTTNLGTLLDYARYAVRGDSLVIDYLSYPADAPVATRQSFVRER